MNREGLGKLVRDVWVRWAKEQPNPKPSWLLPWEELGEADKEVDRRIGEALAVRGAQYTLKAADRAINAARPLQEHHMRRVDGEQKWCSLCKLEDAIDQWDAASEEYR